MDDFIEGLFDTPFIGPIFKAGFDVAYTLGDMFKILDALWIDRAPDPQTPIYDLLCREMGPPR